MSDMPPRPVAGRRDVHKCHFTRSNRSVCCDARSRQRSASWRVTSNARDANAQLVSGPPRHQSSHVTTASRRLQATAGSRRHALGRARTRPQRNAGESWNPFVPDGVTPGRDPSMTEHNSVPQVSMRRGSGKPATTDGCRRPRNDCDDGRGNRRISGGRARPRGHDPVRSGPGSPEPS
jgi:hypothetical protein